MIGIKDKKLKGSEQFYTSNDVTDIDSNSSSDNKDTSNNNQSSSAIEITLKDQWTFLWTY